MRFVKTIASAAALACSALAAQAQAATFMHYQFDFAFIYPGMPQFQGTGTLSFDRSIYRIGGLNYNITGDNLSCTYSAGTCGIVSFIGDTKPNRTYTNPIFVELILPTAGPHSGVLGSFPLGTMKTPGVYTYSDAVQDTTLTITTVVRNVTGPVPEPATWALMILGFCAIGSAMRRRPALRHASIERKLEQS